MWSFGVGVCNKEGGNAKEESWQPRFVTDGTMLLGADWLGQGGFFSGMKVFAGKRRGLSRKRTSRKECPAKFRKGAKHTGGDGVRDGGEWGRRKKDNTVSRMRSREVLGGYRRV